MAYPPDRAPFDDPQTGLILQCAHTVAYKMGRGFAEQVYSACMRIELLRQQIPFAQEVLLPVHYDGLLLPVHFRVDFICYESVLVEVKALGGIGPREVAQVMNYLRASGLSRALLLNFGSDRFHFRRLVWNLQDDPAKVAPRVDPSAEAVEQEDRCSER